MDKFHERMGPNSPRSTEEPVSSTDYVESMEGDEAARRMARLRNKRRALGLAALVLGAAVVVPAVFEPNDNYADLGAKLEIPALVGETPGRVVNLEEFDKSVREVPSVAPASPAASESLAKGNPVSSVAQPLPTAGVVTQNAPQTSKAPQAPAKAAPAAKSVTAAPKPASSLPAAVDNNSSGKSAPAAKPAAAEKQAVADKTPARALRAYAHGRFFIQVVATRNKEAATKKAQSLRTLGLPAYTEIVHRRGSDLWRVRVGKFLTQDDARRALDILALNSIENGGINQEKPRTESGRSEAVAP